MINRVENLNRFNEEYSKLSDTKRNLFSRLVNKLINDNFIYLHHENDKEDYYNVLAFKELIEDYLSLIDFELICDDKFKIFFLKTTQNRNRIRFKKLDTIILLLLRRLYDQNLSNVSKSSNITTTLKQINDAVNETGIYKEIPKFTIFENSLKTLKRYKLINFNRLDDEDSLIIIYPTLLHIVKISDIKMLKDKIESYKINREEIEDENN